MVLLDRMTSSLPPGIAAELQRILSATCRPGLLAAYLFGSHATGRAHRESDVDVGILLDRSRHATSRARFDERVRLSAWLSGALGQRAVDVVVLDDAPPLLARRIVNEGQRLFCADEAADHAFRRDVQLRAADLEPFLRRMRALKLAALAR